MSATVAEQKFGPGITPDYSAIIQSDELLEKFESYLREQGLKSDLSPATAAGRKEIKSRAYAVARHKTALDEAGKSKGDEFRKKLDAINERRREIKSRLEALQMEIGRPVDEWEKQEKARVEYVTNVMAQIDRLSQVSLEMTSLDVHDRIRLLQKLDIENSTFAEMWDAAINSRGKAIEILSRAVERLEKQEEEREDLDRLRRESEERAAREEAERRRAEEAAAAAEAKLQHERLERERAEAARAQAQEAARLAAEEARLKAEREAAEALEAEKRRAAEALAEQQRQHEAEIARLQREREEKEHQERLQRAAAAARAEAQRKDEERRRRDSEHRTKVIGEVVDFLSSDAQVLHDNAVYIAEAIAAGRVPHVKIEF